MSEQPPQTNSETPNPADNFEDIRDLVEVGDDDNGDSVNTLHRPDGSGKLLSVDELEMIRDHQDLIRGETQELPEDDRETEIKAEKIAHYIHKHSKGKGTSPDVVKELYKRLEEENDGTLDEPSDPDNPQSPDAPTLVMEQPRFTPEEIRKQQELLAKIDDADRIFDRKKRMLALKEIAEDEEYRNTDFAGDTGNMAVEAAQRIRVSKTRSNWNPRKLWVKRSKKSNYELSQMSYEEDKRYSLHAAKAMGGNLHIMDKNMYPGRNETIHRANKWYETKVVNSLSEKLDMLVRQIPVATSKLQESEARLNEDSENEALQKEVEKNRKELQKLNDSYQVTFQELECRKYDTLDALGTLRGFGGNEYFGKGIAYLAITKNEPNLLYALEGLDRVSLRSRERPIKIPGLGSVREIYHKARIKKAEAMMIPEALKETLDVIQDARQSGQIDEAQEAAARQNVINQALEEARSIKQPDWRDEVIVRINKIG